MSPATHGAAGCATERAASKSRRQGSHDKATYNHLLYEIASAGAAHYQNSSHVWGGQSVAGIDATGTKYR
jgi:hypothetical protein